jgi:hypothetical protein
VSAPSLPATVDAVVVEFPATDGYRSVGRLVLGGLLSRFELPVDRVEDLLLAVESLLVQDLAEETVTIEATVATEGLRLRVGPFVRSQLADPSVARVVTRLVDEVSEDGGTDGDSAGTRVELHVSAARLRSESDARLPRNEG